MTGALILLNREIAVDQLVNTNNWDCIAPWSEGAKRDKYFLIEEEIPLLCQALLASANLLKSTPVILTTTAIPGLDNVSFSPAGALLDDNSGWLYFPSVEVFQRCAMDAIRDHDPSQKDITLKDCWNQAVLAGLTEH